MSYGYHFKFQTERICPHGVPIRIGENKDYGFGMSKCPCCNQTLNTTGGADHCCIENSSPHMFEGWRIKPAS